MAWRATFDFGLLPLEKQPATAADAVTLLRGIFGPEVGAKQHPEYVTAHYHRGGDDSYIMVRFVGYCPEAMARAVAAGIPAAEGG